MRPNYSYINIHTHSPIFMRTSCGLSLYSSRLTLFTSVKQTPSHCSNIDHDDHWPHPDNFNTPQLSLSFPIPVSPLFPSTHTHTILPHQCYILLKRVSEAERPITLTRKECQKRTAENMVEGSNQMDTSQILIANA